MMKIKKYNKNDGPYLILKDNSHTSMTICWTTSKKKDSFLVWGDSKFNMEKTELSSGKRYHSVILSSLNPDTSYFYTIKEKLSLYPKVKVFSFRTLKENESDKNIQFIIAGDLQPKNEYTLKTNKILALQIQKENPDFIIQTGDLVQIGSIKKYWYNLMKSLPLMASSRPILPVIGNHEYYLFHKSTKFRLFFPYQFQNKKGSYYSKNIGNMHITFLDPYDGGFAGMSSNISKEQKKWFVKDLDKAVRDGMDWIFVVLHQAVLSNGEYSGDVKLQKWILPILSKFDVDAVFWGHAHLYEHWQYQYGENGFVINSEDHPGSNPIDFFCAGSSGASLESNYKLFTHKPFKHKKIKWINKEKGIKDSKFTVQYPWNRDIFFEGRIGIDQYRKEDLHFYHYPFNSDGKNKKDYFLSYNTENKFYGYKYGENTLHYIKVKLENNNCTISVHYPDGALLSGPKGLIPQKFLLNKKNRDIS